MNKDEIINTKLNRIYKKLCELDFKLKEQESNRRARELEEDIKCKQDELHYRKSIGDSHYDYMREEMDDFFSCEKKLMEDTEGRQ